MGTKASRTGGFQVQERDLEIVRWLDRVRLATMVELQQRFGLARSKAYGRLQGLVRLGLVERERAVPGHGSLWQPGAGWPLRDSAWRQRG